MGMTPADLLHEPQAVELGHLHVGHDDGRRARVDGVERLAPVAGVCHDQVVLPLQEAAGEPPIDGRVVHDENPNISLARGACEGRFGGRFETLRHGDHSSEKGGAGLRSAVPVGDIVMWDVPLP